MAEEPIKCGFDFYVRFAKPLVINLPEPNDRVLAAAWIQKLRNDKTGSEKLRTDYLKLLLFVLQRKRLIGPFKNNPNQTNKLEEFPENYEIIDLAKVLLLADESDRRDRLRELISGGGGDFPSYSVECSADLLEYAAAQDIPRFGVHAYYAISKQPVSTWYNADKGFLPKGISGDRPPNPSALDMTGGGDKSKHSVSLSKSKSSPGKGGSPGGGGKGGSPARAATPKKVIPTPPVVVDPHVLSREVPTWGSNLIDVTDPPDDDKFNKLTEGYKMDSEESLSTPDRRFPGFDGYSPPSLPYRTPPVPWVSPAPSPNEINRSMQLYTPAPRQPPPKERLKTRKLGARKELKGMQPRNLNQQFNDTTIADGTVKSQEIIDEVNYSFHQSALDQSYADVYAKYPDRRPDVPPTPPMFSKHAKIREAGRGKKYTAEDFLIAEDEPFQGGVQFFAERGEMSPRRPDDRQMRREARGLTGIDQIGSSMSELGGEDLVMDHLIEEAMRSPRDMKKHLKEMMSEIEEMKGDTPALSGVPVTTPRRSPSPGRRPVGVVLSPIKMNFAEEFDLYTENMPPFDEIPDFSPIAKATPGRRIMPDDEFGLPSTYVLPELSPYGSPTKTPPPSDGSKSPARPTSPVRGHTPPPPTTPAASGGGSPRKSKSPVHGHSHPHPPTAAEQFSNLYDTLIGDEQQLPPVVLEAARYDVTPPREKEAGGPVSWMSERTPPRQKMDAYQRFTPEEKLDGVIGFEDQPDDLYSDSPPHYHSPPRYSPPASLNASMYDGDDSFLPGDDDLYQSPPAMDAMLVSHMFSPGGGGHGADILEEAVELVGEFEDPLQQEFAQSVLDIVQGVEQEKTVVVGSPRRSPGRQSPARQSPGRQSPRRQSPGRQSPGRQSPGRQSPGRRSPPGREDMGLLDDDMPDDTFEDDGILDDKYFQFDTGSPPAFSDEGMMFDFEDDMQQQIGSQFQVSPPRPRHTVLPPTLIATSPEHVPPRQLHLRDFTHHLQGDYGLQAEDDFDSDYATGGLGGMSPPRDFDYVAPPGTPPSPDIDPYETQINAIIAGVFQDMRTPKKMSLTFGSGSRVTDVSTKPARTFREDQRKRKGRLYNIPEMPDDNPDEDAQELYESLLQHKPSNHRRRMMLRNTTGGGKSRRLMRKSDFRGGISPVQEVEEYVMEDTPVMNYRTPDDGRRRRPKLREDRPHVRRRIDFFQDDPDEPRQGPRLMADYGEAPDVIQMDYDAARERDMRLYDEHFSYLPPLDAQHRTLPMDLMGEDIQQDDYSNLAPDYDYQMATALDEDLPEGLPSPIGTKRAYHVPGWQSPTTRPEYLPLPSPPRLSEEFADRMDMQFNPLEMSDYFEEEVREEFAPHKPKKAQEPIPVHKLIKTRKIVKTVTPPRSPPRYSPPSPTSPDADDSYYFKPDPSHTPGRDILSRFEEGQDLWEEYEPAEYHATTPTRRGTPPPRQKTPVREQSPVPETRYTAVPLAQQEEWPTALERSPPRGMSPEYMSPVAQYIQGPLPESPWRQPSPFLKKSEMVYSPHTPPPRHLVAEQYTTDDYDSPPQVTELPAVALSSYWSPPADAPHVKANIFAEEVSFEDFEQQFEESRRSPQRSPQRSPPQRSPPKQKTPPRQSPPPRAKSPSPVELDWNSAMLQGDMDMLGDADVLTTSPISSPMNRSRSPHSPPVTSPGEFRRMVGEHQYTPRHSSQDPDRRRSQAMKLRLGSSRRHGNLKMSRKAPRPKLSTLIDKPELEYQMEQRLPGRRQPIVVHEDILIELDGTCYPPMERRVETKITEEEDDGGDSEEEYGGYDTLMDVPIDIREHTGLGAAMQDNRLGQLSPPRSHYQAPSMYRPDVELIEEPEVYEAELPQIADDMSGLLGDSGGYGSPPHELMEDFEEEGLLMSPTDRHVPRRILFDEFVDAEDDYLDTTPPDRMIPSLPAEADMIASYGRRSPKSPPLPGHNVVREEYVETVETTEFDTPERKSPPRGSPPRGSPQRSPQQQMARSPQAMQRSPQAMQRSPQAMQRSPQQMARSPQAMQRSPQQQQMARSPQQQSPRRQTPPQRFSPDQSSPKRTSPRHELPWSPMPTPPPQPARVPSPKKPVEAVRSTIIEEETIEEYEISEAFEGQMECNILDTSDIPDLNEFDEDMSDFRWMD